MGMLLICCVCLNLFCIASCDPERPYTLSVNQTVGVEVLGLNLSEPISAEAIEQLNEDIFEHQLLVFRNQGKMSAAQQLQIAGYFGDHFDSRHHKHERSEHPLVFRASNTIEEGHTGAGDLGMHNDGYFNLKPHKFVVYHMVKVASLGETVFADSYRLLENMEPFRLKRWDRLWIDVDREDFAHPLIHQHPITGKNVIVTNPMFVRAFIWDYDGENETFARSIYEVDKLLREIEWQIMRDRSRLYFHKWNEGDIIITDNLSILHLAEPDTQLPPEDIGVRVIHRVSVIGDYIPRKPQHMHDPDKYYPWSSNHEDTTEEYNDRSRRRTSGVDLKESLEYHGSKDNEEKLRLKGGEGDGENNASTTKREEL